MHLISGRKNADAIDPKFVVLEIDTVRMEGQLHELFVAVETVPFKEVEFRDDNIARHAALVEDYRARRWADCLDKIKLLRGLWHEELDEFYNEIEQRAQLFLEVEPPDTWSYIIDK